MTISRFKGVWARRKDVAGSLMYWLGVARGFEAVAQPSGAIILMYHSVAPDDLVPEIDSSNRLSPQDFDRQMAFLREHRNVVSMGELVSKLEGGETPPAGTVCITFDDGYLDNLTTAAPILDKYNLPATLFLPTSYIDRAETQWVDALHGHFSRRTVGRLDLPRWGLSADLTDARQCAAARRDVHLRLLRATYAERRELLGAIEECLRPRGAPPRLTMNWDEVRELARRYPRFEIGGHSRNHIDLMTHRGALAEDEIAGCAQDLHRQLGEGARHFSFPYGRWCDETRSMVRASGWRSAVGASDRMRIDRASDRFVLARPATPSSMTELKFRTSGAYPGVLAMFGLH
jgi:peptidoglycan/xylan/chitin deacetylase (PgdA/CDA1 family)